MVTPYEILGVPVDATVAEIRAAYRRLAKTLHPDVGGGQEEFSAVKDAHDVLTDPERRRRYDETGSTAKGPDRTAWVREAIALALDGVMGQRGDKLLLFDLAADVCKFLEARIEQTQQRVREAEESLAQTRKLLGRFKAKVEGRNIYEELLRGRDDFLTRQISGAAVELELLALAMETAKGYDFEREMPPRIIIPSEYQVTETQWRNVFGRGGFS